MKRLNWTILKDLSNFVNNDVPNILILTESNNKALCSIGTIENKKQVFLSASETTTFRGTYWTIVKKNKHISFLGPNKQAVDVPIRA